MGVEVNVVTAVDTAVLVTVENIVKVVVATDEDEPVVLRQWVLVEMVEVAPMLVRDVKVTFLPMIAVDVAVRVSSGHMSTDITDDSKVEAVRVGVTVTVVISTRAFKQSALLLATSGRPGRLPAICLPQLGRV